MIPNANQKPITMRFNFSFGKGGIEPEGTKQQLVINVRDEIATFRFTLASTTKKFTASQNKQGVKSQYIERIQTCLCSYPNLKQQALVDHISNRIKSLELSK